MAFIGTVEEYEEYQKTEKPTGVIEGKGNRISFADIPELSEEDAKIIRQTRLHNNPYEVYMQSDSSFYDDHYNKSEDEVEYFDKEFLEEVRAIRRIYKNYPDWNYAMNLRDRYIDQLIDKYGGEELFQARYRAGLVDEWMPPKPVYSTSSPDYKAYLEGKLGYLNEWDDEGIIENIKLVVEEFQERTGITPDDIEIVGSVMTDPLELRYGGIIKDSRRPIYTTGGSNNTFDGVSTNSIDELQKMIQSWIAPDTVEQEKISLDGMFALTKEQIEKLYYTQPFVSCGGIAKAMEQGDIEEIEEDMNEMVIDSVTGRPMTRRELGKREFVRYLKEHGWDELRLMRHLGVGSNFELKFMEHKQRTHKAAKKKACSFIEELSGEDISTIGGLSDVLFDD